METEPNVHSMKMSKFYLFHYICSTTLVSIPIRLMPTLAKLDKTKVKATT
jgi:hypothetical protein